MKPKIVQKSIRGALWGHMGPQKIRLSIHMGPKTEVQGPSGHLLHLCCMFFHIIHDLLSTMPNYVRINTQQQKLKNNKKNGQTNERISE